MNVKLLRIRGSTDMDGELLEQPAIDKIELLEVLQAVADPVRLTIVAALADTGYQNCAAISDDIDVHKSTASHHYKVLRAAGVTTTRQVGRNREIRLRYEDLNERFPGLLDGLLAGVKATANA